MDELSDEILNSWIANDTGPVALCLRQPLVSVEGKDGVVFPPTYANIGYNIDTLADGSNVATIDSVGSQANRIEPIFMRDDLRHLVPQIEIGYGDDRSISILEVGHRLGDAIVRSCGFHEEARNAFVEFDRNANPTALARLAPTSLLFGVWDSRDTGVKLPRILQSVIRAWDVSEVTRSAQFNPALDYAAQDVFSEEHKVAAESNDGSPLARQGFVHVPAIKQHGGIVVHGQIRREATLNLIALRRLGRGSDEHKRLVRYIFGLALVAATEPVEPYLRQGCLLVPDNGEQSTWQLVDRSGGREPVTLDATIAKSYADGAASKFGVGDDRRLSFDEALAREDVESVATKKTSKTTKKNPKKVSAKKKK